MLKFALADALREKIKEGESILPWPNKNSYLKTNKEVRNHFLLDDGTIVLFFSLARHCVEMLTLIGEKDREVDRMCIFDHSMKPPMEPPEGKKATLYKSPEIFARLDAHAIQVRGAGF